MRPNNQVAPRKGVVLLLTLAILAAFGLIVLAYVVLTGHTRRGAEAAKRFQEQYDPPEQTVMQVALEVIRGSNNARSSIWCHSLLEDLYGEQFQIGTLTNPATFVQVAGGQLWGFPPNFPNPERWVGCPLTFTTSVLAGITTRVVDYDAVNNRLLVVAPQTVAFSVVQNALQAGTAFEYIVNGRPFSGTGIGFDGSDVLGAADPQGRPYALLPNAAVRDFLTRWAGPDGIPGTADDPPVSANEDYDAADYQNPFLGIVFPNPETWETLVPEPSYHRVALIAYWFNQAIYGNAINWGSVSDPTQRFQFLLQPHLIPDPQLRREVALFERKFILRPLRVFHPLFDGSNPAYQPGLDFSRDKNNDGQPDLEFFGPPWPWDVDNDGDGVPDSIWVDVGLPVRQLPDGRRYKPLAAILCVDLDGRLNLNAHGSLVQADPRYYQQDVLSQDGVPQNAPWLLAAGPDANNDTFPDGENPSVLYPNYPPNDPGQILRWIRGLGFGPAEVNLGPLFQVLTGTAGSPGPWQQLYTVLLIGRNDPALGPIAGRYGERLALLSGPPFAAPGQIGQADALLANKFFTFPMDWRATLPPPFGPGVATVYGNPPDMMGAMTVGLDLRGRPIYVQPQALWGAAVLSNPYKINLSPRRGREFVQSGQKDQIDAPFTPAELEAVLRPFDADSRNLAPRLRQVIPDLVRVRHLITTESWDIPVPAMSGSKRWRSQSGLGNQVVQHILQRFTLTAPDLWVLFPPDVLAGLKMDINRPLGDGRDNNNNGVVDEPAEALAGQDSWAYRTATGTTPAVPFDYDFDGLPGATEDPRQALARHLYVLMMTVADLGYLDSLTGNRLNTARMLAQWAVNVVDFRDRDSIMTRFVFDENPFDGWNPINDPQHIVWGCERPELLITETLAFHDRRTEDLSAYGYAYPPNPNDPKEEDYPSQGQGIKDLDQRYRPQGSLFVELYNPWFENEPSPAEFDDPNKTQPEPRPGVDLAKTNPAGQPIWRLLITRPDADPDQTGLARDPDNPDPTKRPQIERAVYFTPRPANGFPEEANIPVSHYPSNTYRDIAKILPGQYAVIGPAGPPDGDITYIGFQGDQGDPNVDRYIRLLATQVIVDKNQDTLPPGINPPVGIRIDRGFVTLGSLAGDKELRLSVSEPLTGYDELEASETDESGQPIRYNPATGRYENPPGTPQVIDQPLDAQRTYTDQNEDWDNLLGHNTTRTRYRVIHLQRLADPTQPYDPVLNPYRTVDSHPVDLTCFNGRTTREDFTADGNAQIPHTDPVMFHTRQRGERNDDPPTPDTNNNLLIENNNRDFIIWKQEPMDKPVEDDNAAVGVGFFTRKLRHTLGYLSEYFGSPRSGPAPYNGDPPRPFPWLTWLNRPYTGANELLLVPALPSSRLLAYDQNNYYKFYRVPRDNTNPAQDLNPYEPDPQAPATDPKAAYDPYPHLTNYFWSVGAGIGGPAAPEFHRVLEFVRVPSPFVDSELQMNPVAAQLTGSPPPPRHRFTPPYHMIPYWREPGRLNLNTIYSPEVFRALLNQPASILSFPVDWEDATNPIARAWMEFVESRRNYFAAPMPAPVPPVYSRVWRMLSLNPDYPTRFANPFRSFGGFSNVPPTTPLAPNNRSLQESIGREVNATLLREKVVPNPNTGEMEFTHVPLFQARSTDPANPNLNHEYEYCDINRNPFFRYRDLMRLGNLVTTRSNTYAIWVTIGYFEVQPVAEVMQPDPQNPGRFLVNGMSLSLQEIQDIYPDGYMLGQELGSDTGDIKRHRGFFIFDRSIPVGFRRGYDLNVDQGLLIKRIIE